MLWILFRCWIIIPCFSEPSNPYIIYSQWYTEFGAWELPLDSVDFSYTVNISSSVQSEFQANHKDRKDGHPQNCVSSPKNNNERFPLTFKKSFSIFFPQGHLPKDLDFVSVHGCCRHGCPASCPSAPAHLLSEVVPALGTVCPRTFSVCRTKGS